MSTMPATARRPFGVSLLAVLIIIGGVFDVLAGILFLIERKDAEFINDIDLTTNQITGFAVGTIIFGVIVILVGVMLRNGSEFARYLIAFLAIVRLASLVFAVIRWDSIHWYTAIIPTILYALVAWYLLASDEAKAFFERS